MELNADTQMSDTLENIFMPHAQARQQLLQSAGGRLVHYTTADGAMGILRSKSLWLRNAQVMHDYSEIRHGQTLLRQCLTANHNHRLQQFGAALDACSKNLGQEVFSLVDQFGFDTLTQTYIACLSEHPAAEDSYGRLSMWRAFGKESIGLALVFKLPPPNAATGLKVFLSPVAYLHGEAFCTEFDNVLQSLERHADYLRTVPRNTLLSFAYMMLMMATVSVKHPAFAEEKEWRLIHAPGQFPSAQMAPSLEVIGGVPQVVYPLRFDNRDQEGVNHISLPELIDRVIVGPTQYALPVRDALVQRLADMGVAQPETKVILSNIPIRN